ncbi:MAG: GtrA family protein [Gammaproteobacteria bacterium]|jgi:putative flippase GtrA|nr:GtrA family protein [Gammaproteobacteria bacterium]
MSSTETPTQLERRVHQQLARFLVVGAVGFAADIGTMSTLIYGFDFGRDETTLILCRSVAWLVAISLTFFLNAEFTFGASIRHSRFINYFVIQSIGAGINLGTYSALIISGPFVAYPLIALMIGSALATINNFLLIRKFVYRFAPADE